MRTLSFLTLLCVLVGAQALTYGLAALSNGNTALVAEGRIHRSNATQLLSLLQQGGATPSTSRPALSSWSMRRQRRRLGLRFPNRSCSAPTT